MTYLLDTTCFSEEFIQRIREAESRIFLSDKNKRENKLSLCGRVLLGYVLKKEFSKEQFSYRYAENGKPYLENEDIFFNISHSGNVVICSVTESEIGCDIQQRTSYNRRVTERFFTSAEHSAIAEADEKDTAFTKLWTMKEAILKKTGEGIVGGLDTYDFSSYIGCDDFLLYGYRFNCSSYEDYEICVWSDSLNEAIGIVSCGEFKKYIDSLKI